MGGVELAGLEVLEMLAATLAKSCALLLVASLADALSWASLTEGGPRGRFATAFTGWPLLLWGAGAVFFPSPSVQCVCAFLGLEHAVLLAFLARRSLRRARSRASRGEEDQ